MCERTCPKCGSADHFEGFGILGLYIVCDGCGTKLAQRTEPESANTDLTWEQAEAWASENTWVLPGAEARNPAHDRPYTPRATQQSKEGL